MNAGYGSPKSTKKKRLAFAESHLGELEARLRTLLADPDVWAEPK